MANAAPAGRTARRPGTTAAPKRPAASGGAATHQAASVTSRALALLGTFDTEHSVQSLSCHGPACRAAGGHRAPPCR